MADPRESVVPRGDEAPEHETDEKVQAEEYQPKDPTEVFEADPADVADQGTEEVLEDVDDRE